MNEKINITSQNVGANLRRLRQSHGETQEQLGDYLGFGPTTIANYESGYRLPDVLTFIRIMIHYNASPGDFLEKE